MVTLGGSAPVIFDNFSSTSPTSFGVNDSVANVVESLPSFVNVWTPPLSTCDHRGITFTSKLLLILNDTSVTSSIVDNLTLQST